MYSLPNLNASETVKDFSSMTEYTAPMDLKDRLLKAREDANMTQATLASLVGKTRGAVAQWESGSVVPRRTTLTAIANATGKSLLWIEHGIDKGYEGLNVVGEISEGTWKDTKLDFKPYGAPVSPHPDFPTEAQRLYKVIGSSADKIVEDGGYFHCVNTQDGAIKPEHNDLVIVRSIENHKVEYTAKRLVIDDGKRILRSESNDHNWQADMLLDDNDVSREITDVVLAKWTPLRRGL